MAIDILTLILETLLKIDTNLIYQYSSIQDQLFYLILIPHVVILMFLWMFGYAVVPSHKGIRYLFTLITYMYIIWSGWYGSWMIPIINAWFPIMIGGMFLFFIIAKVIHPDVAGAVGGLVKEAGSRIKNIGSKDKEIDKIYRKIGQLEKDKKKVIAEHGGDTDNLAVKYRIENIESQISELKRAIKEIEES
ncbi:MAG: hypothetical protein PHU12_01020 [Candidatus Aenigmarchaeota archaeon]|nr:hypothetical protein [Candidatus Aenigmarchaeota archaeon]